MPHERREKRITTTAAPASDHRVARAYVTGVLGLLRSAELVEVVEITDGRPVYRLTTAGRELLATTRERP
jgi:DNA-binding PadR family transcriptional regulator